MPDPTRTWTAALIVIGDEILSGRTQDRNVAQIATWLNVQGIRLREVRVVADDQDAIVEAVNALRARNDYLFTTGGIEGGRPLLSATIGCWVAESEVADLLGATERAHEGCQIGSYPFFREGRTGANFVVRSTDQDRLDACMASLTAGLEQGGWPVHPGGI